MATSNSSADTNSSIPKAQAFYPKFSVFKFHASRPSATDCGDYDKDLSGGVYSLTWDSLQDMMEWKKKEEAEKCIELRKKDLVVNKATGMKKWLSKHIYVCAQQGTGSKSKYDKKHPNWNRKVPSKRLETGCKCRLVVRTYPNTDKVLGKYTGDHGHAIGMENIRFTRLSDDTRLKIADLLRMGVSSENIVCITYSTSHYSYSS
jgi:hypothetical protein